MLKHNLTSLRSNMVQLVAMLLLAAGPSGGEVRTAHYDVPVQRLEADEVGRMLEELHRQLTRFFGRTSPAAGGAGLHRRRAVPGCPGARQGAAAG